MRTLTPLVLLLPFSGGCIAEFGILGGNHGDTDVAGGADTELATDTEVVDTDGPVDTDGTYDTDTVDTDTTCAPGLDVRPDLNANGVPDCAEDLLANGQFLGLEPWVSTVRASIALSAVDAFEFPGSGSGGITNLVDQLTLNDGSVDSECVVVNPSSVYDIYANYYVPSGQTSGDAEAWITVQTYRGSDCTSPYSSVSGGELGAVHDAWAVYHRVLDVESVVHSLIVHPGVLKSGASGGVQARFDNVLLVGA